MRRTQSVSRRRLARTSAFALVLLTVGIAAVFGFFRPPAAEHSPSAAESAALRAHTPPGMTPVPGGYCWLGTDDADADEDVKPKRRVFLPSFYIDIHEVTNAEFHRFDPAHTFAMGLGNLPVTGVTYDQAAAYATWAGKRLPTEEEWEKAARGTDGRRYPWGDAWEARRVAQRARRTPPTGHVVHIPSIRVLESFRGQPSADSGSCSGGPPRVRPVRSVPDGVSPYGCYDMAGNAWEWVQGHYDGNQEQRILRGGAVGYGERACRTYERAIEGSGAT
jgi:formylglycine-generating enzyme required for sulfatase activity